jgi:hypothetical protein
MSAALTFAILLALGALGIPAEAFAQGCAMCKTSLGTDDPLAQAMNISVLFLMAMPYVVVGTVGGWIYLASRRRDQRLGDGDWEKETRL